MIPSAPFPRALAWARASLLRQFALISAALVLLASVVFLGLVLQHYRASITTSQEAASLSVNRLLQASLENAMVKRDLDGLQAIVARLAAQDGIAGVMIANPKGEVRFSSYLDRLFKPVDDPAFDLALETQVSQTGLRETADGTRLLRSVNPVANQARCQTCHGPIAENPINGILIVDYEANETRALVLRGAILLALLGLAVLALLEIGLWLALRKLVLGRLSALEETTHAFAAGDLSRRTNADGHDEIARLGRNFNEMADQLRTTLTDLRGARDALQEVIDAIPDGVRVIGPDYRILMANTAYARQIGAAPEDIPGQLCHMSSHGRSEPCVPTMVTCPVVELCGKGGGGFTCQHEHINAEGSTLSVEVSAAPVTLKIDGTPVACIVESIRDMESDLSISHKQRLAEMGNLAAGVAHEVHNPLASVSLALRAIRAQADLNDEALSFFDIAETEIENCKAITEALLRLSTRPQAEPELVDLGPVLRDTAKLLGLEAKQQNVAITLEVAGHPRVLAHDSDMRNLVFNLALNAIHAMPDGGELTLSARAEAAQIRLDVADTGVGIPERDQDRVLLPFWTRRADGSKGRGLGLAICASIVKSLGGDLSFESTLGEGTRFTVHLPNSDEIDP